MLTKQKRKRRLLKRFKKSGIRLSANDVSVRFRKELRVTLGKRPPLLNIEGVKALQLICKEDLVFLFDYKTRSIRAKLLRELKEHKKEQQNRGYCPIEDIED